MITYQYMLFPGGRDKAVTFSYDDGCRADIRLAELFEKNGLKATFNLCSGSLGKDSSDWNLTAEEVRTFLLAKGHEVAVHGAMHRAPGVTRKLEGIRDVLDCRIVLERECNRIVRGMAYPNNGIRSMYNGMTYDKVCQYLADLGIVYARTLGDDNDSFDLPADWYAWMPSAHHNNPNIFQYIDKFIAMDLKDVYFSARQPHLLYIWGHSFEFDRNQNWDRIEQICQRISNRSDIWYATNGEIYDYTEAYRSLVYSADGSIIYNPTLFELWFSANDTPVSIKPGETVNLH